GEPLIGAVVKISNSAKGSVADENGNVELTGVTVGMKLVFSFLGMQDKEITFEGKNDITIELEEKTNELDEVTVVAFGKMKKESVVASITTINPDEMRLPSSNLTQALAGRIAGIISYQRNGEPGLDQNNAEFFIRGVTTFGTGKKDPLILIDGVEMTTADLARLTLDDIASFSVMKDANATALYGARGANGVILVTTREGKEGAVKIQFRAELSHSSNTSDVKLADPITYMKLHNEAVVTRDPMAMLPYSEIKVAKTEEGYDPVLYPAVDWMSMLFNDHTLNHRYNLNISGGGSIARYYIAASYSKDNGIINVDKRNSFNNNISQNRYVLRSNVNVNLSKTTEAIVRLNGNFDDYSGPLDGGSDLFTKARNSNPTYFLPYYQPDDSKATQYASHILFGNYGSGNYLNPYAEMLKGYKSSQRSSMLAQFELKQDLNFVTEGLSVRGMFNVNRLAELVMRNAYNPFFYNATESILNPGKYMLVAINPDTGRDYLDLIGMSRKVENSLYFEGALQYNREFDKKHATSAMLVYTLRDYLVGSDDTFDFQTLMPHRNLGLAGRLTYGYDSRYFIEFNFGYNGSERFAENERFGFFPSIGGGYIISNEKFMQPFSRIISKLKLKATYGLVGNDQIGNDNERFYYLSKVNMNDGNRSYTFGDEFGYSRNGISISRYEDRDITWEISRKLNLGVELNLFNDLEIQADYFTEDRSNILQARSYMPTTMGLQATPLSNIGKAFGKGIDVSVDYNKSFTKDFWGSIRGNFTYATARYTLYDEPDYSNTPWRLHKNIKLSQRYGYIAERLFLDDEEVRNSPKQFEDYMAGDIKYKDINGDMVIDENDQVPIGYPTTPEIIYGWGLSVGYKAVDLSFFFQGSGRSSFFIDPFATAPFVQNSDTSGPLAGWTTNRALLQYWADDHWSENNRNIYAQWPRLSDTRIANNSVTSTWWMRDGSFMRLKNFEAGYTFPDKLIKPFMLKNLRIYLSGSNLFVLSKFKMWDVEQAGNGLAYPLQRVINIGINADF
ncbi:MAG: TonB-dependent receptor, partial [Dysgonamonadaceae bacterium]|nr:TonB-dependent receptor [Dysgonamonadaceae bacterium]